MIPKYISETWTAVGPALGDHLWQSTLFAIAAGLLTLVLRKNHARTRYWLWLAASLKFLVPFSLLAGVGSRMGQTPSPSGPTARLFHAMTTASQPFAQSFLPVNSDVSSTAAPSSLISLVPALLAALWLVGLVLVLAGWYLRWRKISAAIRSAVPLHVGRETEALRRMESIGGIRRPIEILLSPAPLEPGIFGLVRPVLIWPQGISEHLEDAHLQAIVAHEIWHVRRHDNLAAAIHMLVEALFWFHPLVWWLGAQLVDERERACDEEVLESVSERQTYAESILKTCEFCAGFPLACVSGVTGADLKKRIITIMTRHPARRLTFSKRLLLATAGLAAIAIPITVGFLAGTPVRAESPTGCHAASQAASQEEFQREPQPVPSINPDCEVGDALKPQERRSETPGFTRFTPGEPQFQPTAIAPHSLSFSSDIS